MGGIVNNIYIYLFAENKISSLENYILLFQLSNAVLHEIFFICYDQFMPLDDM